MKEVQTAKIKCGIRVDSTDRPKARPMSLKVGLIPCSCHVSPYTNIVLRSYYSLDGSGISGGMHREGTRTAPDVVVSFVAPAREKLHSVTTIIFG
jgi:hypothetical protein